MKRVFEIIIDSLYRYTNELRYDDEAIEEMAWIIVGDLADNDYEVSEWLYNFIDSSWCDLRVLTEIENEINALIN